VAVFLDSPWADSWPALALAVACTLLPGVLAWWWGRGVIRRAAEPLAAERWLAVRQRSARVAIGMLVPLLVLAGEHFPWLIALLIVATLGGGFPARRVLLGETWGWWRYLLFFVRWTLAFTGFWIALVVTPGWIAAVPGVAGRLAVGLAVTAGFVAWSRYFTVVVGWLLGARPLAVACPELAPVFAAVRARSEVAEVAVAVVPIPGGRLANAFALPSLRQPTALFTLPLLELTTPREAAAIFGHELAHLEYFRGARLRRLVAVEMLLIAVGGLVLPPFYAGPGAFASWLPLLWPLVLLGFLLSRLVGRQQHEQDSDLRALTLVDQDAAALVGGLVKVHLANRVPRRWDLDAERGATHPSLARRIQAIEQAARRAAPAAGGPTAEAPAGTIGAGVATVGGRPDGGAATAPPSVAGASATSAGGEASFAPAVAADAAMVPAAGSAAGLAGGVATPQVVVSCWGPGAWLVLDETHAHWLSGLPLDAQLLPGPLGASGPGAEGAGSVATGPAAALGGGETRPDNAGAAFGTAAAVPSIVAPPLAAASPPPTSPPTRREVSLVDVMALAASTQSYAYRQLVELRVALGRGGHPELVCRNLAGQRWATPLRAEDVAAFELHLNHIDGRLAPLAAAAAVPAQQPLVRALAGLAAAVGLLPGVSWVVALAGLLAAIAPRARQLAWLAGAALASAVWLGVGRLLGGEDSEGWTLVVVLLALLGAVMGWIALRHRPEPEAARPDAAMPASGALPTADGVQGDPGTAPAQSVAGAVAAAAPAGGRLAHPAWLAAAGVPALLLLVAAGAIGSTLYELHRLAVALPSGLAAPMGAAAACWLVRPRRRRAWLAGLGAVALPVVVLASPWLPRLAKDPLLATTFATPVASVVAATAEPLPAPQLPGALQLAPDGSRWAVSAAAWDGGVAGGGAPGDSEEAGVGGGTAGSAGRSWDPDELAALLGDEEGGLVWQAGGFPGTAAPVRIGAGEVVLLADGDALWLVRGEDGRQRLRRLTLAAAPPHPLRWEIPLAARGHARLFATAEQWQLEVQDYGGSLTLLRGSLANGGPIEARSWSFDAEGNEIYLARVVGGRGLGLTMGRGWSRASPFGLWARTMLLSGLLQEPSGGEWIDLATGRPLVPTSVGLELIDGGPDDALVAHVSSRPAAFWRLDGPGQESPQLLREAPAHAWPARVVGRQLVFVEGEDVVLFDLERQSERRLPGLVPTGSHLRELAYGGNRLLLLRVADEQLESEVLAVELSEG
jgi:Zn-dependent protease with chaperone function